MLTYEVHVYMFWQHAQGETESGHVLGALSGTKVTTFE